MNRRGFFGRFTGVVAAAFCAPKVVEAVAAPPATGIFVGADYVTFDNLELLAGPGLGASGTCEIRIDAEYFRKRLKGKYDQRLIDELVAVIEKGEA